MRPISRKVLPSGILLQNIGFGLKNTVASIGGSTKKLGERYQNATIVLYNRANFNPVSIKRPDKNGYYEFPGLNNSIICFIVALDDTQQYNAVIQDNVVPK